jgi:polar amino acid transport system substrate-binding protein
MWHAVPACIVRIVLVSAAAFPAQAQAPLRAGVDATYAPFAYPSPSGQLQGFSIDLVEAIGKRLGRPIETTTSPVEGLAALLHQGRIDVIAAPPITVTRERTAQMLFAEPYLDSDLQLLRKSDGPPIGALSDLKGRTIAVAGGSAFETWARGESGRIGWIVEPFPTQVAATQAVLAGEADATVTGSANAAWIARQMPALALSLRHATGLVWALPVRVDQVGLRAAIDGAVECMKRDGTLAALHQRWFGIPPAPSSAAATVFPGAGVPDLPGFDPAAPRPAC